MKLSELIKKSKLSSREIEGLTGINNVRIWRLSKGEEPKLKEAKKLCNIFKYPIQDLD